MAELTRRKLLAGSGVLAGAGLLHKTIPHSHPWEHEAHAADAPTPRTTAAMRRSAAA